MCFPAIGPILSVVGTIASGYSAQQQAKYQERMHELNARAAREQAAADAERFRRKADRSLSTQRVAHAASGADPHSDSLVDVAAGSAGELRLEELGILHGGEMTAARELAAARYARAQGQQALASAIFEGAQTVLGSLPNWSPSNAPVLEDMGWSPPKGPILRKRGRKG
jgi:hypothetical protein